MRDVVVRHVVVRLAAGILACVACKAPAQSQTYPTRPVTFVIPFSVGGAVDIQLRALAIAAEKHLGQPIVLENRPSATGTLGPAQVAASARPDGYTITQVHTGVLRLPFMTKTTYDPATDFTYIVGISGLVAGLVVRSDSAWKTFDEFVAYARANSNKISYGSAGGAVSPYIVMRADRQAKRRRMDGRTVQKLCGIEQCAPGRPYPGRIRRHRLGAAR